jgi:dTMP kinase
MKFGDRLANQKSGSAAVNEPFNLVSHGTSGRFIAVEGMNGCGASTIVRKVCRELESDGYDVLRVKLPSDRLKRSSMFQVFHRQNRRSEIDPLAYEVAYMADKLHTSHNVILPALEQGKIVVADRYLLSSIGALLIRAPELATVVQDAIHNRPWFRDIAETLVKPDLSIHLFANAEVAVDRFHRLENNRAFDIESNAYQQLLDEGAEVAHANGMHLFDTTVDSVARTFSKIKPLLDEALTW